MPGLKLRRRHTRSLKRLGRLRSLRRLVEGYIEAFNRGVRLPMGWGLFVLARDPCAYCGGDATTWDHIEPRARGGENRSNLVRSCRRCNLSKYSTPLIVYLAERAQRRRRSGNPSMR